MAITLDQVDILAAQLKKLLPMKREDKQRLDKKFRLEFNYNSNHMEGNTLTYGETELLLIFDDTQGNHTMREYEEMKAHDVAYHLVEEWAKDKERPLTEQSIKNLNEVILVRPYWKDAITSDGQNTRQQIKVGDYKEYPNSVRLQNGEIFEYATPTDTPILMHELIDWYREEESKIHAVTLSAMLHYKFVRIHPFDDGNGRISRLLMNYVLLRNDLPPVVIKSEDKANYLRTLNRADVGDYEAFITYVMEQVIWSLELSIKAAKGERIEDVGDFIKEVKLLKQKTDVLDLTRSPKLVYNIFEAVRKTTWAKLSETLAQFDGLFTDCRIAHRVNNIDERFPEQPVFNISTIMIPKTVSTNPQNPKIFGHDIYEMDITSVEWCNVKYGLRGSKENGEFEIKLLVTFGIQSYKILLKTYYKILYEVEKKYNDLFLSDETDKINKVLQQYILTEVKKRTQTEE